MRKRARKLAKKHDFEASYIFDSTTKTVIIDAKNRQILIGYILNVGQVSAIAASSVIKVGIDTGEFMGATRCVAVEMTLNDKKERIVTFSSNKEHVLN